MISPRALLFFHRADEVTGTPRQMLGVRRVGAMAADVKSSDATHEP
jgi:hypothetical protein